VRAFIDGAWGFASTSAMSTQAIDVAIAQAIAAARATARVKAKVGEKAKDAPAGDAWRSGVFRTDAVEPLASRPFDEKIALARDTEARARRGSGLITSASCTYTELVDEKFIATSDGARVHLFDAKPELRVSAVASKDGELSTHMEASGKTGGLRELFARRSPQVLAERAAMIATDLLRAPPPPGGKQRVILAPDVVGLLVHEAIGHTVEADFVLSGSAAAGKLGARVASELVTLCDSGMSEHEAGAGGIVLVDDEGVPTRKVELIERGVLRSYLHNRETAAHFGVEPTGNARAFEYDNEPLIRMRNTYIEPGATPLADMIAGVEDGWLLQGAKNGQADANAEFMFVVAEAYPIVGGKLGTLHKGTTITGDAFEVLTSVDAVGDAFAWDLGSGYCGKGQPAKVDAGGPHVRCTATLAAGADERTTR
jgi:TldD protein